MVGGPGDSDRYGLSPEQTFALDREGSYDSGGAELPSSRAGGMSNSRRAVVNQSVDALVAASQRRIISLLRAEAAELPIELEWTRRLLACSVELAHDVDQSAGPAPSLHLVSG